MGDANQALADFFMAAHLLFPPPPPDTPEEKAAELKFREMVAARTEEIERDLLSDADEP